MKLFTWDKGRQGTGYESLTLVYSTWLHLDCYLLRYREGAFIPKHKDVVAHGNHYRLNLEITKPEKGGAFFGKTIFSLGTRLHLFRPDLEYHGVARVAKGTRYVLSIGKVFY